MSVDVVMKVRGQGLRIVYAEKTGKVVVDPADQLTDKLRAEIVERRADIVAALVAEAGGAEAAWGLLGVSDTVHVAVLVAGLAEEEAGPIRSSLTRGLALLAAHRGPIPQEWVDRMQELHREALEAHWARHGDADAGALFRVLGSVPLHGGVWLENGLKRVDAAVAAKDRETARHESLGVVDAAVAAWLVLDGDAPTTEGS